MYAKLIGIIFSIMLLTMLALDARSGGLRQNVDTQCGISARTDGCVQMPR